MTSSGNFILAALAFSFAPFALGQSLAELPPTDRISASDIGKRFYVEPVEGIRQEVLFVGFNQASTPIAFPVDAPEYRTTFNGAAAQCSSRGPGWGIPVVDELRLLTPHANSRKVSYLPGSSWTSTLAPCSGCKAPERYRLAYDVNSANVRNSYDHELFKFYPACVYRAMN